MLNEAEPGEVHWKYKISGRVRSSPTVGGNTVFVGSTSGRLHAIDVSNGQKQWKKLLPNGAIKTSPAIDSNHVYACNNYGYVAALDRATGAETWSVSIDGGYTLGDLNSSPLLYQETVYVGMHDGKLYAIDAASGEIQWGFQTGSPITTSPIAVDGKICIGSGEDLYAISASDGKEQWVFTDASDDVKTPTEHDGTLYFGSEDAKCYAVNGTDGKVEWTNDNYYRHSSTPTVHEGSLYIGVTKGPNGIANLDPSTGEEQWVSGTSNVFASPTVAGGTVFFCNELGKISAVDLDSQEYTWTFRSESSDRMRSSPTVVDGILYVGSDDGNLYALNAGTDGSSEGSRIEDRSLGHHTKVSKPPEQSESTPPAEQSEATGEPVTATQSTGISNETTEVTGASSQGDTENLTPLMMGAGGSAVTLMGYLFGKKALGDDTVSDGSDTEPQVNDESGITETSTDTDGIATSDDGTLDLEEPDD